MPMLALASVYATFIAATAAMSVPDPRPDHHVVDLTGTLTAEDIAAIDGHANRGAAGGELMVVVVNSVDGSVPRDWTTVVFNNHRLDTMSRNRGVLFMAALGDRKAEIVIGDGYPDFVTQATDAIMAGTIVRNFKDGEPRKAIVEGARAIVDDVLLGDAGVGAASTSVVAPTVPPDVIAAASHPAVLALGDARTALVDDAHVMPSTLREQATGRRDLGSGYGMLVATVKNTADLSTRMFARGYAHRMGLDDGANMDTLLLVVAPAELSEKTPTHIDIVYGAALPRAQLDPSTEGIANEFRARIKEPRDVGSAIGSAMFTLSMIPVDAGILSSQMSMEADEKKRRSNDAWAARIAAKKKQVDDEIASEFRLDGENPVTWLGGGIGLLGLGLIGREIARRRPRKCAKCKVLMSRLGEEIDDKHLKDGERAEERLGSVDYDIWMCPQCSDVVKTRWGAIFTTYKKCASCSWKTMTSTSRTLTSATTASTGLAEVTERCTHCSHHRTYTVVIPRVTSSSSSGSSGGGGGGFSSGRGSSGSW